MNEIIDQHSGEVLTGSDAIEATSMVQGLAKAEIDQQIATAHKFPRSVTRSVSNMVSLATLSRDAAAECNYALPRGGKSITGPSIRMAELVHSQWGNCRVGARVVHVDRVEKYLEAEGIFHDLESNAATTARVRQKISDRNGKLFNDDMITIAGNAACSKAKRNAVLAGVPKGVWMAAYEAALATVKGDAKTLTERREGAMRALGAFGVTPDMIFTALEIEGIEEITLEHMPTLIAWHTGLKNEESTVEQLFGKPGSGEKATGKGKEKPKDETLKGKLADVGAEDEAADEDAGKSEPAADGQDQGAAEQDQGKGEPDDADSASDGDEGGPDQGALDEASDRGSAAALKGRARGALPAGIKGNPALTKAFQEAYDAEKTRMKEGKT